jgi:hypothetical protein
MQTPDKDTIDGLVLLKKMAGHDDAKPVIRAIILPLIARGELTIETLRRQMDKAGKWIDELKTEKK